MLDMYGIIIIFVFCLLYFFFIFAWKMDFWKIWHDIHFFYVFYHFFLSCKQKSATKFPF